jgi:MFS family permease
MRLAALRVPAFRWLWAGHFLYVMSLVMYRLALGWLTLSLTNSPFWVGLAAGVDGAGKILTGFAAGVIVDRFNKRAVLLLVQLVYALLAIMLGGLIVSGAAELWHVLGTAFVLGGLDAVAVPANGAIIYQVVGRDRMMNATALNILGFNAARTLGAALAGNIMEGWGPGVCFVILGGVAGLGLLPILAVQGVFRSEVSGEPFWHTLRDGLRFAWRDGAMRRILGLSVMVETFAFSHLTMIPVLARDVLQVGATGLGYLTAASGLGATAMTLLLASRGDIRRKGHWLWSVTIMAGGGLIAFALSPWYALSLVLSALLGGLLAAYDALIQTIVQLLAPDAVRGRILSLYTLTFGFASVGGSVAGYIASLASAPFAVALGGGVVVAYLLSVTNTLTHLRPMADSGAPVRPTHPAMDELR